MKIKSNVVSSGDINKVVYDILKQSKSFDVFPTPVDDIVRFAELQVDKDHSLHTVPNHYISKNVDALKRALRKVFGALDRRQKLIYLEPGLLQVKKHFIQLHEVGHHSLPWQRDTFDYVEDEQSLAPETKDLFEAEANFFASAALFQLDRFESLAEILPLEIKSVRYLAKYFGASIHATIRRYVETINKRCALLVLKVEDGLIPTLSLRNYFQSSRLTMELGRIPVPNDFGIEWPFVVDYIANRIAIDKPEPLGSCPCDLLQFFEYQYFYNRWNVFVLLTPIGERIATRTTIIVNS
jgi:Zn-dependent peptidase ImmA (M78 family)